MQIRLATQEDAEIISALNMDVQKIHAEALPHLFKPPTQDAFPPTQIREWLETPGHYIYLGYLEGQAIGYIYAEVRQQPETSWRYALESIYIHHICLKAEYQTKGHGAELMEAVKVLAQEKGIKTLALDVWSFNIKAKAFFHKQGFVIYNERMWQELEE